jgi:beta-lactamase regulating signal transducer with metallopeptidase domain
MNGIASMFEIVYDAAAGLLQQAIYAGGYAALLAAPVLLINLVFRRWLSAGQLVFLWGLVLVRLLLPVAPATSLSLQNLISSEEVATAGPQLHYMNAPDTIQTVNTDMTQSAGPHSGAYTPIAAGFVEGLVLWLLALLPLVWIGGAVSSICWNVIGHWQLCRQVGRQPACRDERLLRLWRACCQQVGMRVHLPIVIFDRIRQPAVTGVVRPTLLLPTSAGSLDDDRLRLVMLHELAHVRRRDVAINWGLILVRAIHWWNPVYWLAASRFNSLREQACDSFAIRQGGQPTRVYRELLLTLAERELSVSGWRVTMPASLLSFLRMPFGRRGICNRISAMRFASLKQGRAHTAAVIVAILLLAACGLTDAKPPEQTMDASDWMPQATIDRSTWTIADTTSNAANVDLITRTYDIKSALDRISSEMGADVPAEKMLEPLLRYMILGSPQTSWSAAAPDDTPTQSKASQRTLSIDQTTLTVHAPAETHAELQRCLKAWEEGGLGQVSVECLFLTGLPDLAAETGISWQYMDPPSGDTRVELQPEPGTKTPVVRAATTIDDYFLVGLATLSERQAAKLRESAQQDRRANVLQAPKVTLFNGQHASILDVTQTPFVVGMRQTSVGAKEPKIAIVDEGMKLALRVTQGSDRASVRLSARIALSDIDNVRTVSTSLGDDTESIQIPRVKRCNIDVASEVADGQSLLIGCVPSYDERQLFYVLLTARTVKDP